MTLTRDMKFTKADYEALSWWVGVHRDEDGKPLVVVDEKCIGDLDGVIDFLVKVRDEMPGKRASLAERIAALEERVDNLERDLPIKIVDAVRKAQRTGSL